MLKVLNKALALNCNIHGKDVFSKLLWVRSVGVLNFQTNGGIPRGQHSKAVKPTEIVTDVDHIPRPNVESSEEANESIRLQKIKRAMQFHLKKLKEEADLKADRQHEYEIGCRHLANMMGADPNTFTQRNIHEAIEYLMPSGLFETRARPVLKPPSELEPMKKGSRVDKTGRPENTFFYTGNELFNSIFYELSCILQELNEHEDKMIAKGFAAPPPETKIFLEDSEWISMATLTEWLNEKMKQSDYDYMIDCLESLVEHPYSFRAKNFIMKYRKLKMGFNQSFDFAPLTVGEDGIPYAEADGFRKRTCAQVTVRGKGSGKVEINGTDISFFTIKQDREQLLFPLKFTGLLNEVDFQATLTGEGGHSAEAGAIRIALSKALCSFVSPQVVEEMRLAGLLNWDVRTKERGMYGQKGARAKLKWRKR